MVGDSGPRTVVLVSGGGTNLQAIIDRQAAGELHISLAGVISDRPGVRALERAEAAGIPALTLDHAAFATRAAFDTELGATLERLRPDIVVLAGFMRILPGETVQRWQGRMLNVHPSLLPLYPGLHTYRRALAAGDAWHGSTVHFVTPELDAGPAIIRYRVRILPGETEQSLAQRVQRGEYLVYPQAIGWLAAGTLALREGRAWLHGQPLATPVTVDES
jgi:phosphoribosylglycinamide formyltransferase-1